MTTTVKIDAHCDNDTEVSVIVSDSDGVIKSECLVLNDGESRELYVYDTRQVLVMERPKQ